jgi:hypothetical protein
MGMYMVEVDESHTQFPSPPQLSVPVSYLLTVEERSSTDNAHVQRSGFPPEADVIFFSPKLQ